MRVRSLDKEHAKKFYIVNKEILPETILKTAQVKELLARGEALTVNDAVDKVGISRSAFYKYRDGVFPFYQATKEKIITVSLILEHKAGILSDVLNTVAQIQGNILTINQGLPMQNVANVNLAIDTKDVLGDVEDMISKLQQIDGVKKVEIIGQS